MKHELLAKIYTMSLEKPVFTEKKNSTIQT